MKRKMYFYMVKQRQKPANQINNQAGF